MTWQTNSVVVALRNVARKAGLTRPLARMISPRGYEHAFDDALFSTLREGDCVWDVGANVGYYTKRFGAAVGSAGQVVAFEPFPDTIVRLRANLEGIENCRLETIALGAEEGTISMQAGGDDLGATNRIVEGAGEGVPIKIRTGDSLVADGHLPVPTVLKIDVEGFELDVLLGMEELIANPRVRALFIEVHFGLLAERGTPKAPADIAALLTAAGFAIRWVDPSHISARRG